MTDAEPAASLMAAIEKYARHRVAAVSSAMCGQGRDATEAAREAVAAHAEVKRLLVLTMTTVDAYAEVCRNCPTGPLPADGSRIWAQRIAAARAEVVRLLGVDDDA